MTTVRRATLLLALGAVAGCASGARQSAASASAAAAPRPRVVVTADPELDDSNSLLRYLLHSPDFRTEGLIYASSGYHWKGDGTRKKWYVSNREYTRFGLNLCPCESWRWAPDERFIDDAVDLYERAYENLRVHDPRYPAPAELRSKVRWGNVEFDGDISKNTPGSDLIKSVLLDDEPGPVYLLAWGGQSTIARALTSIQEQYAGKPEWPAIRQKVSRKAVLSTSGDQDDTHATYIRPNWPEIRTLPAGVGGVPLAYGSAMTAKGENARYYSVQWTQENISSRGALGAFYRVWGDGKQMVKGDIFDYFGLSGLTAEELRAKGYVVWLPPRPRGEFLGEGDTFTYLNLVDNGLLGYRDETPGGWAGHGPGSGEPRDTAPNFTRAAQHAFAARLTWSVTPAFTGANHEPKVWLRGSARITVAPGATIRLEGVTSDPDGNRVSVRWWRWKSVDSYPGEVVIAQPSERSTTVQVPADATAGQTIQLVLEATDDGAPALTRYQRVVIVVGS